ncbi:hypothetical protein T492DRAFT_892273 [Pavlovales sp. CCMP2436]|nr:hypothetical protein T492DRAFT_892273 [Pavlovales sp. CCMP2436]
MAALRSAAGRVARAELPAPSTLCTNSAPASELSVPSGLILLAELLARKAILAESALSPRLPAVDKWAELLSHKAMWAESTLAHSPRRKLSRRHASDFAGVGLFNSVARAICEAGVLPRKELFETWAVAIRVQAAFPHARRVADVASGHGLLAWMLLLLDDSEETSLPPRTAVCIDRRMPASAERIEQCILLAFPELAGRWSFVEADAAEVEPHASCLLLAVHACGGLSDLIVAQAIAARAPVALVPCCHSLKKWSPHPLLLASGTGAADTGGTTSAAARSQFDALASADADTARRALGEQLVLASLSVEQFVDGSRLTAKNTLFFATPGVAPGAASAPPAPAGASGSTLTQASVGRARVSQVCVRAAAPRLAPPSRVRQRVRVPVADHAACLLLSGRFEAESRKAQPPPSHDVSVWLPPAGSPRALTAASLEALAQRLVAEGLALQLAGDPAAQSFTAQPAAQPTAAPLAFRVCVQALDVFTNSHGRSAQTFRLEFVRSRSGAGPTGGGAESALLSASERRVAAAAELAAERERAIDLHFALFPLIAAEFPGAEGAPH